MIHEIYYTSAPQGLRPGQQGWCTVAATAGIPKLLWDRMESLSAYPSRSGGPGGHPVVWAHWIVRLRSEEHHVISRLADAGVDYSRRANSFAHHMALEGEGLPSAGPAWLLSRPGLMAEAWNGEVRILPDRPLPDGHALAGICHAWERATGDAGWAGVLAGELAGQPGRPIWLIHRPGQLMLPLLEEAIQLLPVEQRWQATFHTHFANLPPNTLCTIRCCEAGSATATTALRGGGGFVLNLSAASLPPPGDSPWVLQARTGRSSILPPAARPTKPLKPAPKPSPKAKGPPPVPVKLEIDPNASGDTSEPPPIQEYPPEPPPEEIDFDPRAMPAAEPALIRPSKAPPPAAQQEWLRLRGRQRTQRLVAIYVIAIIAILAAAGLSYLAYQASPDRAEVPYIPSPPPPPPPPPVTPVTPTTRVVIVPPPPPPATTRMIDIPPPPTTEVAPRPLPQMIVLPNALAPPAPGTGLRDPKQTINIPKHEWDDLPAVRMMAVRFANDGAEVTLRSGSTFNAALSETAAGLALSIRHRATGESTLEIAVLELNRADSRLEITWRNAALVRRPELCSIAWWLLSGSTLTVADAGYRRPQGVRFAPIAAGTIDLATPSSTLGLPTDLPAGASAAVGQPPAGWKADSSGGVMKLERDVPDAPEPARFELRLDPAKGLLLSDLADRRTAQSKEMDTASAAASKADADIKTLTSAVQPILDDLQRQIEDSTSWQTLTPDELQKKGHTPESLAGRLKSLTEALATQQQRLADATAAPRAKKTEYDRNLAARKAILAALERISSMEIVVTLDDVKLVTIRSK